MMADRNDNCQRNFPDTTMKPPPDKRRKTDSDSNMNMDDNLWDDDDLMFTQENLDAIMTQSLVIGSNTDGDDYSNTDKIVNPMRAQRVNRIVGKGSTKSRSTNDAGTHTTVRGDADEKKQRSNSISSSDIKPQLNLKPSTLSAPTAYTWPGSNANIASENERLKKELAELRESQRKNQGQINILQNNIKQKEADLQKARQEKVEHINHLMRERSDKEQSARQELDKLRNELEFIKHELDVEQQKQKSGGSGKAVPSSSRIGSSPGKAVPCSSKVGSSPGKGAYDFSAEFKSSTKSVITKNVSVACAMITEPANTIMNKPRPCLLKLKKPHGNMQAADLVCKLMQLPNQSTNTSVPLLSIMGEQMPRYDTDSIQTGSTSRSSRGSSSHCLTSLCSKLQEANSLLMSTMSSILQGPSTIPSPSAMLTSDTASASQLLSTIEESMERYIAIVDALQSTSGSSGKTVSTATTLDTPSSSDMSLPRGTSAHHIHELEFRVTQLLGLLVALVSYSLPVCQVIIEGALFRPTAETQVELSSADIPMETCKCQILPKLCRLANPKLFENRNTGLQVCILSLRILLLVLEHCQTDNMQRLLEELPVYDILLACISEDIDRPDDRYVLGLGVLRLLLTLSRSHQAVRSMCTFKQDDCILDNVYHFCVQSITENPLDGPSFEKSLVHQAYLMQIFSRILTHTGSNSTLLTKIDCHCGLVIGHLLTILYQIYKTQSHQSNKLALMILHQGLSVLQNLAAADIVEFTRDHENDPKYVELLYSMEQFYQSQQNRECPSQELLSELQQDFLGAEEYMDVSSDAQQAGTSYTPTHQHPDTPSRTSLLVNTGDQSSPNHVSSRPILAKSLSKSGKKSKLSRDKRPKVESLDLT